MNRPATVLLVLTAVLSSVTHAQRPTGTAVPAPQNDTAGATATLRALFAAAERNDMKALDTLYAGDSLTVVEGAGINRGWTDYRDHHLAPEMKEMKNFHYRPVDIEMHVSGNTAWALYRYNLKGEMGSRTLDNVGRGTAILERRGSGASARWVVRHTQTSSRARRPSDPPAG
ncbi:nuclear transport factor 2 family protein [Gemmatimonas sp.]|uniref:YybH family protein n=1 Tax=Gemmatimonas sp. TaxID=1962908 RepID=UPI00286B8F08|nr:nuclear transport factor 2 family protein [Gemmatimonas sp.]